MLTTSESLTFSLSEMSYGNYCKKPTYIFTVLFYYNWKSLFFFLFFGEGGGALIIWNDSL